MFGQLLYAGTSGYAEYLLADENGVRAIVCMVCLSVTMYRIEWKDATGYGCNTAVYSLADAMAVFQEKIALPQWLGALVDAQESVGQ